MMCVRIIERIKYVKCLLNKYNTKRIKNILYCIETVRKFKNEDFESSKIKK